ncbi:MAG: flagellin FliC [Nitrospinae bacterium]|nr:flagellin FliC [Nitrospinota bacterium]
MPLRVYSNLYSLNAQRNLGTNNANLGVSLERLSSGLRVNRGADDAAGLAISEKLRSDIRAIGQAVRNSNDGISIINTAEGALSQQASMLTRMRELAAQASTGSVGSTERQTIQREFAALRDEIDRITTVTEFNGQKLVDGSLSASITTSNQIVIQIGFKSTSNDRINLNTTIDLTAMDSTGLAIQNLSVTAAAQALTALSTIGSAISKVTDARGRLGAVQNRFTYTIANLQTSSENLQAAESQIREADYASEISTFTRNQILVQASTAILAQANLVPQTVLQLLG